MGKLLVLVVYTLAVKQLRNLKNLEQLALGSVANSETTFPVGSFDPSVYNESYYITKIFKSQEHLYRIMRFYRFDKVLNLC